MEDLTNDKLDDLVEEWHLNYDGELPLKDYILSRTMLLTEADVVRWLVNASLPGDGAVL